MMRPASLLAVAFAALCITHAAHAEVRRVVSLNPCLDAILLSVADRKQIAALSHFSRDRNSSTIADVAATLPMTYESAEEVISFSPDLVLTSRHSSLATRNALRRVKIKTELFTEPKSVEESIAQVRYIAGLVNRTERGEDLVMRIEAALASAAYEGPPLAALIFQSNGFTTGGDTLVDEMLRRTGFVNVARRYGGNGWGNIPLEHVIADPPQVLLAGAIAPDKPTWADRVLRHPALRKMEYRMTRATFPDKLIFCGGPVLIESAKALAGARKAAAGRGDVP
jgi:iron complex transport system substrate-binding protein